MAEYKFRDVSEHDMDMLFVEEFASSEEFAEIFLSKANIGKSNLISTWISKTDNLLGESDITVIFEFNGKKIALLIENKINAVAMPEQPSRYFLRGEKGISDKSYDLYYVFIVAPYNYLNTNEKAKEYPFKVSYEEICNYFKKQNDKRCSFKLAQINFAIEKQKRGYQAVKDANVTDFWNKYSEYQRANYPSLKLSFNGDIHPTRSVWPYFRTNLTEMPVIYKSDKGCADLTFNGQAQNTEAIKDLIVKAIGDYTKYGLSVVTTGKSCAARLLLPYVDFSQPFEEQKHNVELSFQAVNTLMKIADRLDFCGIGNLLKN